MSQSWSVMWSGAAARLPVQTTEKPCSLSRGRKRHRTELTAHHRDENTPPPQAVLLRNYPGSFSYGMLEAIVLGGHSFCHSCTNPMQGFSVGGTITGVAPGLKQRKQGSRFGFLILVNLLVCSYPFWFELLKVGYLFGF